MKSKRASKHILAVFCSIALVFGSMFIMPILAYTEDTATYTFEDNYAGWTSTTSTADYNPAVLSLSSEYAFAGNNSLKVSYTPVKVDNSRTRISMPVDQLAAGKIATYRFYLPAGSPITQVNIYISSTSSVTINSLVKGGWNTVSFSVPPVAFSTTYHFINFIGPKNVPFDAYIDSVDFNFPEPVEPVVDPVYGSNIIRGKYFKGAVAKLGNISNITWFDMYSGNYLTNEKMTDGNTTQHYDYNYGDKAETDYPAAVYDLGDYYDVTKMTAFVGIKDYEITGMNFYASEDLDNLFSDVNKVFTITDDLSFEKTLDINENPKRARFVAFMMTTHNKTNFRAKEFEVYGTKSDESTNLISGVVGQSIKTYFDTFTAWTPCTFGSSAANLGLVTDDNIFTSTLFYGGIQDGATMELKDKPGMLYDLGNYYDISIANMFVNETNDDPLKRVTGVRIYASDTLDINDGASRAAFASAENLLLQVDNSIDQQKGVELSTPRKVRYIAFFMTNYTSGWRPREFEVFGVPHVDGPSTHSVSLQKSGENFEVSIVNWQADHQYQIWTYQATESDIFGGEGATNQWMLSLPYTLGSDRKAGGFTVEGDSITRNIGSFASVDSNYTVAVKVIDGAGNFVGQYKETFTPAEANVAGISKVTVDGQFADEKAFVKDISSGSPVQFFVTGNGATGTVFTAKLDQTGTALTASGAGLNEFSWDISTMAPGNYSVTLTASTANDSDSRTINFRLYKVDYATPYGLLTGLEVAGGAESGKFKIDITPTVSGGKFRYRISEPWRTHFNGGDSGLIDIPGGVVSNTVIPDTAYGIYQVATYTYRDGVPSADDGAIRTVNNPRDGEVTLGVNVDGTPAGAGIVTKPKGTEIVFAAEVTVIPSAEYSFWRRDANGWVMIRDWAASGEITWTPNRVGLYTIQVRVKDAGGLTYEAMQNIEFDITYAGESRAVVTGISINQATLDSDASARTPILITANATADSQDLLYKFIISNGYIYYVETAYSADPTYMWVPGKAGNYTINVLVKNQASFGKYDGIGSFTVDVN